VKGKGWVGPPRGPTLEAEAEGEKLLRDGRGSIIDCFLELADGLAEDSDSHALFLLAINLVLADGEVLVTVLCFFEIDEVRGPS